METTAPQSVSKQACIKAMIACANKVQLCLSSDTSIYSIAISKDEAYKIAAHGSHSFHRDKFGRLMIQQSSD
jgi:hypothetical protein